MATELLKPEPREIVRDEINPMGILQMAVSQGADIDKLEKLMAMQERWEANAARKAFVQAMSDFKREAIVIVRDKENKQYSSKYASIGNIVNTVTPFLSKHGLSASWSLDQSAGIRVACKITHALGHSESIEMLAPLDTSGAKNPLQQIKSSITYARIVTFEMACGLASTEANADDDGNGSGKAMDLSEFDRAINLIEAADSLSILQVTFAEAYKVAQKAGDAAAMKQFIAAKDKRKQELR